MKCRLLVCFSLQSICVYRRCRVFNRRHFDLVFSSSFFFFVFLIKISLCSNKDKHGYLSVWSESNCSCRFLTLKDEIWRISWRKTRNYFWIDDAKQKNVSIHEIVFNNRNIVNPISVYSSFAFIETIFLCGHFNKSLLTFQTLTLVAGRPTVFSPVIWYRCPACGGCSPRDAVVTKSISKFGPPNATDVIWLTSGNSYSAKTFPILTKNTRIIHRIQTNRNV